MWQADHHRILYWNRFGTPEKVFDKFGREESIPIYWFYDIKKAKALEVAEKQDSTLPEEPKEIRP